MSHLPVTALLLLLFLTESRGTATSLFKKQPGKKNKYLYYCVEYIFLFCDWIPCWVAKQAAIRIILDLLACSVGGCTFQMIFVY